MGAARSTSRTVADATIARARRKLVAFVLDLGGSLTRSLTGDNKLDGGTTAKIALRAEMYSWWYTMVSGSARADTDMAQEPSGGFDST